MRLLAFLAVAVALAIPAHSTAAPVYHQRAVCTDAQPGQMRCYAHALAHTWTAPHGLTPQQLHSAYSLPWQTPISEPVQTVAVVDAYNAPTIESDLATYSAAFGLPACSKANGCLRVVDQTGGSTLPEDNADWAVETSLDVEMVHAICPTCRILLVEAYGADAPDLARGVKTAVHLGAAAISNSYGESQLEWEPGYKNYFHRGVAIVASSGDNGYGVSYPASIGDVVAAGGTSLFVNDDGSYDFELAWSGAGSGCARAEHAPIWQLHSPQIGLVTGCGHYRSIADVSAVADPNTGVAIYDSTPDGGLSGWWQVGGTSVSSPIIASVFALAGGVAPNLYAPSVLYRHGHQGLLTDVIAGANGHCNGTAICAAGEGYDGPSGLGTPNGIAAFVSRRTVAH